MQGDTTILTRPSVTTQSEVCLSVCPIAGRVFTSNTELLQITALAYSKWRHRTFRSSVLIALVNRSIPDLAPASTPLSTALALGYFNMLRGGYRTDKLLQISEGGIHHLHKHTVRTGGTDDLLSPKEFSEAVALELQKGVSGLLRQALLLQTKHAEMLGALGQSSMVAKEAVKLSHDSLNTSRFALEVVRDELKGQHRYK